MTQNATPEVHYTTDEVAAFLRLSAQTIRGFIKRGELPAVKVGRDWRVTQTALDEYLDTKRRTSVQAVRKDLNLD